MFLLQGEEKGAVIYVNDTDRTPEAAFTASSISWTPSTDLMDGEYTAAVAVFDSAGNTDSVSWSFTVSAFAFVWTTDDTIVDFGGMVRCSVAV
ncbi:hypothetical protein LDC_0676, partial [sediment metagenome]